MSFDGPAIKVRNLSKCYEVYAAPADRLKEFLIPPLLRMVPGSLKRKTPDFHYYREFWALRGIDFEVQPGETVGIIGRNGGGKSTLLQILAGTLSASSGEVEVHGRVAALLELGSGFNPDFTGRENVYLNAQILGLTRSDIDARFQEIADFADIGDFIDQPVKTYSSGMFVRLAFAVHAHIDASIVIIDEALAVGDIFFREKCYRRLDELRQRGAAIILVSHSMPDIEQYCDRAIVLNHGGVHFSGSAAEAARHYYLLHQQTADSELLPRDLQMSGVASSSTENLDKLRPRCPPRVIDNFDNQVGNGGARCTSITLCNEQGLETQNFRQGETAVFHYTFELDSPLDVPIVGIVIKNERGVIVHGKNSWQFQSDAPLGFSAGDRIFCRHEVKLTLGPGEYLYEVGLSTVPRELWLRKNRVSHQEMSAAELRVCHVNSAGMVAVGLAFKDHVARLTHHGIADLAGSLELGLELAGTERVAGQGRASGASDHSF